MQTFRPGPLDRSTAGCASAARCENPLPYGRGSVRRSAWRGFTLVELLVVVAILGLLVSLIVSVAGAATRTQKRSNTLATMKNVELALDQFAVLNPLRLTYDGKALLGTTVRFNTFGPYVPYELWRSSTNTNAVCRIVEPNPPQAVGGLSALGSRIYRDLGATGAGINWVQMDTSPMSDNGRLHDDNRALSAYLGLFVPDAFASIPQRALRALRSAGQPAEFIDTAGQANQTGLLTNRVQVLGIHDGWDVPIDYFLAVRVAASPDGQARIVERVPVLRSLGIDREVYEARYLRGLDDPQKWVFTRDLPGPFAEVNNAGIVQKADQFGGGGWLRAIATGPTTSAFSGRESYWFTPDPAKDGWK